MSEKITPFEDWITANEAAEITSYTAANIRKALRNGYLSGAKRGGVWFVARADVMEYVRRMKALGKSKHDPRLRGNWPSKED